MTKPFSYEDAAADDQSPATKGFTYEDATGQKPASKGIAGHARDMGLSLAKGVIGVPEAIVGLADIPTGGAVGKALENADGALGFRPRQAKEFLSELHTDQYKTQQREFQQADGILAKTGAALQNPSMIANAVAESVPPMLAGGVAARGVKALAPSVGAAGAGAAGEGAMMAGSQAEAIRQETTDGLLTPGQAGLAAATGVAGAAFGFAGGRVARKLGIGDVDTMLAQGGVGAASIPAKAIPRQVIEGALSEGLLEELPQSVSEQILQNLALAKPWHEGVDEAVVMGTLSGMAMGGGAAGFQAFMQSQPVTQPDASAPEVAPQADMTPSAPIAPAIEPIATLSEAASVVPGAAVEPVIEAVVPAMPEPVPTPSQAMGLDPAAGPLSAAATVAVDSAAATPVPTAEPVAAPASHIYASYEEADAYRREQSQRGSNVKALPYPVEGGFALVPKGSPEYAPAQQLQAERRQLSTPVTSTQGAANVPQATEAQQASPQPQKAGGAPADGRSALGATPAQASTPATGVSKDKPASRQADLRQEFEQGAGSVTSKLAAKLDDARYQLMQAESFTPEQQALHGDDLPSMRAEVSRLEGLGQDAKTLDDADQRENAARALLQGARQELDASDLNTTQKQAAVEAARTTGNAADASEAIMQAVDAGSRWAALDAAGRAAVANQTDIAPVLRKNLPKAQWDKLNPEVQAKLATQMQAAPTEVAIPTSTEAQPVTYEQAKARADAATERSRETGKAMDAFPKGAMGLTPDAVRASPEWQAAKREADQAFAEARAANTALLKDFKKEASADRDAKRARKVAELAEEQAKTDKPLQAEQTELAAQGKRAALEGFSMHPPAIIRKKAEREAWEDGWMKGKRSRDIALEGLEPVTVGDRVATPVVNQNLSVVWRDEAAGKDYDTPAQARAGMEQSARNLAAIDDIVPVPRAKAEPAVAKKDEAKPESSRRTVRTYTTKSGKIGAEVKESTGRDGRVTYSYTGKWGAGSGIAAADMGKFEAYWTAQKRGFTLVDHDAQAVDKGVTEEAIIQTLREQGVEASQVELAKKELADGDDTLAKDLARITKPEPAKAEVAPKKEYGAQNKLVSQDRREELKRLMRAKAGQLNSGIDPDLMAMGAELAVFHIEAGTRKFADFAKAMMDDIGEKFLPYVRSFYDASRSYPGLDTEGMTPYDETVAMHKAMMTPEMLEAVADAIGEITPKPAKRTRKTGAKADMTLTQDWGVEHIDGYSDDYNRETGNSVKDAFLKEARTYLSAVATIMTEQGYTPHNDSKGRPGRPVSVNESGTDGSGDVTLTLSRADGGAGIYVSVGETSLRGVVPSTQSGIGILYRAAAGKDRYGSNGTNHWAPVDLSAADLALMLDKEAQRAATAPPKAAPTITPKEAQSDDTQTIEANAGSGPEGQAAKPVQTTASKPGTGRNTESATGDGGTVDQRGAPDGNQPTGNRGDAGVRGRSDATPAGAKQPVQDGGTGSPKPSNRGNRKPDRVSDYRIAEGELKREGSWRTTAGRNVDIVEMVKAITAEGRQPTDAERAQMAKFTGWGASEIANGVFPDQYGRYKSDDWKALGQRLQAALTPEEYAQAKRTTQYAHYTSEAVIRSIYTGLDRLGFKGGALLEPGMGIGHFKGMMPAGMEANSSYTGIEYDTLTGNIAKMLYPESNVIVGDYTRTKLPKDFFDAAIGNPPFSAAQVLNDPEYKSQRPMLHDYFFMKTIDRVKPGGVLVFVTSKGTMDKTSDKSRKYLAERANLLGAIRLPQTAFKDNAGTEVVTDVIFLQKKGEGIADNDVQWLDTKAITTPEGPTAINQYFADHPEMVLGTNSLQGSMYKANEYTVLPLDGNIEDHFAKAVARLPENVVRAERGSKAERAIVQERDYSPSHKKEGGLYLSDKGKLLQVEDGSGVAVTHRSGADGKQILLSPKQVRWLQGYVGVRDALKQTQFDQLNEGPWEKSLKALNKAYDGFVKEHGPVLDYTTIERTSKTTGETTESKRFKNEPLLRLDAEGALAYALENIREDGSIAKGAALNGRVLERPSEPVIQTTTDALFVSLNRLGTLDMDDVASLANTTRDSVIEDLGTAVYEAPDSGWQVADEYLSGNVVKKLAEAKAAANIDAKYQRNVDALLAVQPRPLGPTDITVRLGANWLPASDIANFATEVLGEKITVGYSPIIGAWSVDQHSGNGSEFGFNKMSAGNILDAVLNARQIKVTYTVEGKTHVDLESTEKANDIAGKMRQRFSAWVWADTGRAERLLSHYNEHFNNIAPRTFDGSHLTLPGVSSRFKLYPHQKRAVWRVIQQGDVYLAHSVGAGKTMEMIAAGMEERRLGLIKKPMYAVPNHMLAQFSREFLELYPAANIMVADEHNFHTHNRKRFVAQAALNDPDAIIITHAAFGRIGMSEEYSSAFIQKQIDAWTETLDDVDGSDRVTVKQIQRRIEQLERRMEGKQGKDKKDQVLDFEELGVDKLYVDEFHEFRKLDFPTNQGNIKGIDPNGSQRALDLHMKTEYLREKKPGRALVAASGTPITNTMGELFTVQRFFQPEQMREDGLDTFDAWSAQYGDVVNGFEQNAAGGYEMVARFAKFQNVPELMRRVRSFMDILTSSNLGELVQRPDVVKGGREIVVTPVPTGYKEYQQDLQKRIQAIRGRRGPPVKGEDIILSVIGDGRFSAIDMRFVDSTLPSDPNSKLNLWVDDIIAAYHDTAGHEYATSGKKDALPGGSVIGFTDIGLGEQSATSRGFDMKAWIEKRFADAGIPREHLAFMRDHKQHAKKERLFADMRSGKRRILIGGKEMETGTNVQKRLTHLFHLDAPWFPASVEQREGRIIRQGNQNAEVTVKAYATKGSYDSTMWGMNARKARFIEQAMNGDDSVRSLDDVSEASSFEMASALASGDERYLKLAGLKTDVERLDRLRYAHHQDQNALSQSKSWEESLVKRNTEEVKALEGVISQRVPIKAGSFLAHVGKKPFDSREDFSQALFADFKKEADAGTSGDVVLGKIGGFDITYFGEPLKGGSHAAELYVQIPQSEPILTFPLDPSVAIGGLATRAANIVNGLDRKLDESKGRIARGQAKIEQVSKRIGASFPEESLLIEKMSELSSLEVELATESEAATAEAANQDAPAPDIRYSAFTATEANRAGAGNVVDGATVSKIEVDGAIASVLRSLPNGLANVKITIVDSFNDLPANLIEQAVADDAAHEIRGLRSDEGIFLVRDKIQTAKQAEEVIFHELAHEGLRKLFGKDLTQKMNQLLLAIGGGEGLYRIARKHGIDLNQYSDGLAQNPSYTEDQRRQVMMEELLAHIAEEKPSLKKRVQEIVGMVREWLRNHGFANLSEGTEADLMRLLQRSRNALGTPPSGPGGGQPAFSRQAKTSLTASEAFKKWFGKSPVVDEQGRPRVVYHGTTADFSAFDIDKVQRKAAGKGFYFTSDPKQKGYAEGDGANVMPVYLKMDNPTNDAYLFRTDDSYDGLVFDLRSTPGVTHYAVRNPEQIKSATGNNGEFDATNPDIRFARTKADASQNQAPGTMYSRTAVADITRKATDALNQTLSAPGKISLWHKTVGTMYNLAERAPAFKPVFTAAQGFIDDVSYYANDAAEHAPKLLPKLETMSDMTKSPISAADNRAISRPIFEGTLSWSRDDNGKAVPLQSRLDEAEKLSAQEKAQRLIDADKLTHGMHQAWQGLPLEQYESMIGTRYESQMLAAGVVWSDAELQSLFKLNQEQITLYREFRAATDRSLDTMARADMLRFGGKDVEDMRAEVMDAPDAQAAAILLRDRLIELSEESPDRAEQYLASAHGMIDRADRLADLQAKGYAPLSRFGQYTVDVVVDGERQYFGLFDTAREANKMAARMQAEFGAGTVTQGTLSNEEFKLYAGITPESLELFGNMLGLDSEGDEARDQAFQKYLRLTKTNRSAMRRLIHRKGIAGYSEDAGRVLASFIYSNARQTAAGLNMGDLGEAVQAIPQQKGELKDAAMRLAEYIKNPQEEAQAIRGLLFAQYLGGSVASAFVNMTQPVAVSFPWLSQYGGARKAATQIGRAARDMATRGFDYEADLSAALKLAEDEGTVSPQEVHQLMAQARGAGSLSSGDGTRAGELRAQAGNARARMALIWGKVFSAAEQVNRRMTYIAAFRTAREQGMADPAGFAKRAVQETQFVYSKASKMRWGRGAVGGTLMTFKTYSIAYMELLHRMYTQGGPEGKKAALLALGVLMLMGGAGGLPFAEDAEDLADGLAQLMGYNISVKKAREELLIEIFGKDLAGFIDRGVTGLPGMPLDVSGRLGMGNLVPGTGFFQSRKDHSRDAMEIAGPMGDLVSRTFSGARRILGGDVGAGLLEMSPVAVRNAAKGVDMAATGMYRDTKGYKVLDTSHLEAALKAVGFQPASVATVQEANWVNQRAKSFYTTRTSEVRALWAAGIFEGDQGKVERAREAIATWNQQNPSQPMRIAMPSVWDRVREMRKSKDQRIADSAPKAMRAQMRAELTKDRGEAAN